MFDLLGYLGRTNDFPGKLFNPDGTGRLLAAGDLLRFKIATSPGAIPLLEVSHTPTDAGSVITVLTRGTAASGLTPAVAATYSIHLAQADMQALWPGTFDSEIVLISADLPDGDNAITVDIGVFHTIGTLEGLLT